jgi:hypothetical protein
MLYVRQQTLSSIPQPRRWRFATKLQLAARLVEWIVPLLKQAGKTVWIVIDGGYTKRPFLSRSWKPLPIERRSNKIFMISKKSGEPVNSGGRSGSAAEVGSASTLEYATVSMAKLRIVVLMALSHDWNTLIRSDIGVFESGFPRLEA